MGKYLAKCPRLPAVEATAFDQNRCSGQRQHNDYACVEETIKFQTNYRVGLGAGLICNDRVEGRKFVFAVKKFPEVGEIDQPMTYIDLRQHLYWLKSSI